MAKDPAFLFYPGDWLAGTMTLMRAHKGAYMDLLMAQHNCGHMSIEEIKVVLGSDYEEMWESKLKNKFVQDADGKYFNEKLENEILKRKAFTDSRKKNLKSDSDMRAHMSAHMDSHMENRNNNSINREEKESVRGKEEKEEEPISSGSKKPKVKKVEYAPGVFLSENEYKDLSEKYTHSAARWMINKLSNYKAASGRQYKSDAAAIRTWVIDEWTKQRQSNPAMGGLVI